MRNRADLGRRSWLAAVAAILTACGGPTAPSPPIEMSFSVPVSARIVACTTCTEPPNHWLVAEFPVTISDPRGDGGSLASVVTRVVDRSRGGLELARNVRPSADFSYPAIHIPAGGALTVQAGIVVAPLPPPRDEIVVEVTAVLADGRSSRREGTLVPAMEN